MCLEILNKTFLVPPAKEVRFSNSQIINKGKVVGLWGSNGVGKSTLLKKLYTELFLHQYDLLKSDKEIEYKIGIMPQNVNDLVLPWLKVDKIIDVFQSNFPNTRYNKITIDKVTNCSKKARDLSGGERQMLAFELMLSADFEILFLDEPFSAMDSKNIRKYKEKLHELIRNNNTIIFIVLHDLLLLQNLSDIFLLFRENSIVQPVENTFKECKQLDNGLIDLIYNENY